MIVAFDGVCVLCNRFVLFLIAHDHAGRLRFASNQSSEGVKIFEATRQDVGNPVSVVLNDGGRYFVESTAAIRAIASLGGLWRLASALRIVPAPLRDAVYRVVARNRYGWFGKLDRCPLPKAEWADRFLP
jgi:predicted DCC family thiol-disulfide oxidoreductase YuxK